MRKIELDIRSPWALLITLMMGAALMSVLAFADHDDDNYEKQKANIDMANDGIVGYTHDGLPVLESDIPEEDRETYIAKGLRSLDIDVKLQKGLKANVLNENTLELFINDKIYTILLGCVNAGTDEKANLTNIDFFDWAVVGKIEVGSQALVTRNPVKNFGNPALKEMMKNNDVRLRSWDFRPRTCVVVGIQIKTIVEEE